MKNLKSFLVYTLSLLTLLAVSCSSDKTPKELIVNTWNVENLKWSDDNQVPDSITKDILNTSLEFTSGNKYIYKGVDSIIQNGDYNLTEDGKILTLTSVQTGNPEVNQIKELSKGKLIFTDENGNEFILNN